MTAAALLKTSVLDELLEPVEQQVKLVAENRGAQKLRTYMATIKMEIAKYDENIKLTKKKIEQITGDIPPLLARTRSYQQHDSVLGSHQNYIEHDISLEQKIRGAKQRRFAVLKMYGLPEVKDAEEFYLKLAERNLKASEKEGAALILPKDLNALGNIIFWGAKLSVGAMNGISLNLLINVSNMPGFLGVSLLIGVGVSLLMLKLVRDHAFHYIQQRTGKHLILALTVVGIYMVIEGAVNFAGIMQLTANAPASTGSYAVGDQPAANPASNVSLKMNLLIFTLGVVMLAAWGSFMEGRRNALKELYNKKVEREAYKLKISGEYKMDAVRVDLPSFLAGIKKDMKKPDHKPRIGWHNRMVNHLSKEEIAIERRVSLLVQEADRHAGKIQAMILDLSDQANESLLGRNSTTINILEKTG